MVNVDDFTTVKIHSVVHSARHKALLSWDVVENRESVFRDALELQVEFWLSSWGASILAAALASGAEELWSEDFQSGRAYRGVLVVNPFQGVAE